MPSSLPDRSFYFLAAKGYWHSCDYTCHWSWRANDAVCPFCRCSWHLPQKAETTICRSFKLQRTLHKKRQSRKLSISLRQTKSTSALCMYIYITAVEVTYPGYKNYYLSCDEKKYIRAQEKQLEACLWSRSLGWRMACVHIVMVTAGSMYKLRLDAIRPTVRSAKTKTKEP